MYGSGVRTGMTVIAVLLKPILLVHRVGLTACFAAVAGAAMPSTAVHPFAADPQAAAAATTGCASPSPSNMLGIPLYHLLLDAFQMEELNHYLRLHKIVDVRKELPNNISSIALQKRALDDFLKKNE